MARIWGKWAEIWPKTRFLKFGSLVFLDIAYNDSLQQCITSSRGKTHQKNPYKNFWGPNLGQRCQNRPGTRFFFHFLKFGTFVFLEIAYNNSLQQCITSSRGKIHQKNHIKFFGAQIWAKDAKIGLELSFLFHFLRFGSLVFLEIAYNDCLQQCVTSTRGETSSRCYTWGPNLGQN